MDGFWLLNGIPYGDGERDRERDGQVLAIERDPLRGWREGWTGAGY